MRLPFHHTGAIVCALSAAIAGCSHNQLKLCVMFVDDGELAQECSTGKPGEVGPDALAIIPADSEMIVVVGVRLPAPPGLFARFLVYADSPGFVSPPPLAVSRWQFNEFGDWYSFPPSERAFTRPFMMANNDGDNQFDPEEEHTYLMRAVYSPGSGGDTIETGKLEVVRQR